MANRRMLSKSISTSKRLARVSDAAALLFTWLIPHCDDAGNMDADPMAVKGIVLPMRPVTVPEVEAQLKELADANLIVFYPGNPTETFLHIDKWENHQTLRGDRPDFRFPPRGLPPVASGLPNGKHNGTERNGTELNGTEEKKATTPKPKNKKYGSKEYTDEQVETLAEGYISAWNQIHGTKYKPKAWGAIVKNLAYWLEQYEPQDILQAMVNIKIDSWWKDKATPVKLLRTKNKNGDCDNIGELLHAHGRSENIPPQAKMVW